MLGALAGSAHVQLAVSRGQFSRDMALAERDFLRSVGRIDREARTAGVQFARGLGAAVLGTVGPLYLFGKAINASWDELVAMRREAAQTEAVLASTGGVANVTAQDVERLAEAGLRLSGVDDQIIHRGLNVLLTFRGVRNEVGANNDIYNQAAEALLDMGVALERSGVGVSDLQSHAIRLGRALQDPIRGVTALRRVGVQFTEQEEDQIKRLVEAGRVMEAQKIILGELRAEFGGSAREQGEEFTASLARMREAAVGLGGELLSTLIPTIEEGAQGLEQWLDELRENEELQREFREAVEGVAEVVIDLAKGADTVADALGGWEDAIKILIGLKIAVMILGWTRAMRGYTGATWGAVAATSALAIAQGAAGATGWTTINPRTGLPFPRGGAGGGGGGGWLGRAGRVAGRVVPRALIPSVGAVAAGSVIAVLSTPGAGGGGDDPREYPFIWTLLNRRAAGQRLTKEERAVLEMIAGKRPGTKGGADAWDEAERRAQRVAGRTIRSTIPDESAIPSRRGQPTAPPTRDPRGGPGIRTELSVGTQQALADAERTESDVDNMKALIRAERELEGLLRQEGLTKQERLEITRDLGRIEQAIRGIEDARVGEAERAREERERAAEERRKAAQEARENAHEQRAFDLERRVDRAEETDGVRDDIRWLNALRGEQVRWRNAQKRNSDEWRSAQAEIDQTDARIAQVRKDERTRRQENRLWAINRRVRLAEETETIRDDLVWLERKRRALLSIRSGQKRFSDDWKATQEEIDATNRAIRETKRRGREKEDRGGLDSAFFQDTLRGILEDFAPNFFPGGAGDVAGTSLQRPGRAPFRGKAVEVHQHFPTAPTDYHREGRFAAAAIGASFDG